MRAFRVNRWPHAGLALSVFWAMVGGVWGSTSLAQTSKDYAVMGKKAYAAFECAALASFARDEDEQHRLFQLGYDEGKTFLEALRNGKIEAEDVNSTVPVGITLALEGPTADFILGRVWKVRLRTCWTKLTVTFRMTTIHLVTSRQVPPRTIFPVRTAG